MQWPREFVTEFVDPESKKNIKLSHKYTARYPMLSVTGQASGKGTVIDFVPGTSKSVILAAGCDGFGFKYGSIVGLEIADLCG